MPVSSLPARAGALAHWLLIGLFAVFAAASLTRARLTGDGLEYLLMSQALVAHGSPEVRESDLAALAALPAKARERARLDPGRWQEAMTRVRRDGALELGFARGADGEVYAIHFWVYSLLAAPLYALAALLQVNPFLALASLNLVFVAATAACLRAWFPQAGAAPPLLLLVMGPLFYGFWPGPEVMSGCCVLLAVLAALRRDLALAVFLAGLGATQNPPIAGLIPAAGAYWLLYRLFPGTILLPATARPRGAKAALVCAGIALAALPWAYNQRVFGTPSIIGKYFTDRALVTPERMFSFLFDLNQGLFVGFPALLAIGAVVLASVPAQRRAAWSAHFLIAFLLTLGMAAPALSATNWNSGAVFVSRYAYWGAMPMLAVGIAGLAAAPRARRAALALALLLQLLAAWQVWQGGAPTYLAHSRLAQWVLDHAPRFYNPDPEIFLKRSARRELLPTHDLVGLHQGPQGPTKLLRYWTNAESAGLCGPGTQLAAEHVVTLASGWRYYNGKLRCVPGRAPGVGWTIGARQGRSAILGAGWSQVEDSGVWTDGRRAVLVLPLPEGRQARALSLEGGYVDAVHETELAVNGVDLGPVRLGRGAVALPPAARAGHTLTVELRHPHPALPAGAPAGSRALGFFLRGVYVELSP
ncbi:hypothetical protein B0920_07530 [Massilia sp. KIM]|uniref:hypothetical protein n=1 Tax=Massilia sp. KIM TaxID=1955422 RepID=UPI00098FF383|nr:hypothetical protein [Massilia sp. KIM]OON63242.1 hypothetical protein B0920_07530 [Massilia sp. KIM]